MKDIIQFLGVAIETLSKSSRFAEDYVELKREFFIKYQTPFIFSTRFGAEFFAELHKYLSNGQYLKPDPGQTLGEYDDNVNKWLRKIRN